MHTSCSKMEGNLSLFGFMISGHLIALLQSKPLQTNQENCAWPMCHTVKCRRKNIKCIRKGSSMVYRCILRIYQMDNTCTSFITFICQNKKKCSKVFNNIECSRVSLDQARDFFGMTDTLGLKSHIYMGILLLR